MSALAGRARLPLFSVAWSFADISVLRETRAGIQVGQGVGLGCVAPQLDTSPIATSPSTARVEQLIAMFLATKNFSPLLHCATIRPSGAV